MRDEAEKFWMLLPVDVERSSGMSPAEHEAILTLFDGRVSETVHGIPAGSTVIPRFRFIPFGRELELEVEASGSTLLNCYREHRAIADLFQWVTLLEGFTAPAFTVADIPRLPLEGEWFVKGATNSVKNRWFDLCYANGRERLIQVVRNNQLDGWVGSQEVAIRPFEPFRQVATAVDGRPVFNEWRVFILDGKVISEGYYWSSFVDDVPVADQEGFDPAGRARLLEAVVPIVADLARFVVVDVAETVDGGWRVVELNDGVMSGLSENDPWKVWGAFTQ